MKIFLGRMMREYKKNILLLLVCIPFLVSCGRAYFPLELKTVSRSERVEGQEKFPVDFIPMTKNAIKTANKMEYKRFVIDGRDLLSPAKFIQAEKAFKEKIPNNNEPGPYLIGAGDEIGFGQIERNEDGIFSMARRKLLVSDLGFVNIYGLGVIKAEGLSEVELGERVYQKLIEKGRSFDFELQIVGFNSKRIYVSSASSWPVGIPYVNYPIYLEDVFVLANIDTDFEGLKAKQVKVVIDRGGTEYIVDLYTLQKSMQKRIRLFPGDKVNVEPMNYKPESILIVGETGTQRSIQIDPDRRPTLSSTLFSGNVLSNITSDFSQIYVIRQAPSKLKAFHLDITDPTRILLANSFEMRPDDIVFIATQPLSLYSRTLQQVLGSTGLTLQARDTIRNELGN